MSFLTPLYLLGGLAIALPIIFHLIRKTPQGRQVFSSLMFLEPSPPKVTKRSRIDDWLLLLLRSLAVCLLAVAFARPFLRAQDQLDFSEDAGRRFVVLVDTSASMQRAGFWDQAKAKVEAVLASFDKADVATVATFDHQFRPILGFSEWAEMNGGSQRDFVLQHLQDLSPTDAGTELGQAMMTAADLLEQQTEKRVTERAVIVISDLQQGSHWETLNGYQWPDAVSVELHKIDSPRRSTNVAIQHIGNPSASDDVVRVRVSNSEDADKETFELAWQDEFSSAPELARNGEQPIKVYVPPGQVKVFQAPQRPIERRAQRLVISGDDFDFDNTCFVARREPWQVNLTFIGADDSAGADSLLFFLRPLFSDTPLRKVNIQRWTPEQAKSPFALEETTLLIVGGELTAEQVEWSRKWLDAGGAMLFVATSAVQGESLYDFVAGATRQPVIEASITDYAMLSMVDFTHPILAPFDDPRYADFSKLRFWKHRTFDLNSFPSARLLATFDDEAPAMFEVSVGDGRVLVLASGWNRSDSELAVWSKFVPLMNGVLENMAQQRTVQRGYRVGDQLVPNDFGYSEPEVFARGPSGSIELVSDTNPFQISKIGIYEVGLTKDEMGTNDSVKFAVNLDPDETQTAPLSTELLATTGIPVTNSRSNDSELALDPAKQRQLMNRELESKQQLWKWLILAALVMLLLETALSGLRQRRQLSVAS